MGGMKGAADEGYEPLPAPPTGYHAVGVEEAAEAGEVPVPQHQWTGSLLACCGSCDAVGCGSFFFAKYLPCFAWGYNMKRAFKHSAWFHGFVFLALFMVLSWLAAGALMTANHNVLARCNGELPPPGGLERWAHDPQDRQLWGKAAWENEAWKVEHELDEGDSQYDQGDHHHSQHMHEEHEADGDDGGHHIEHRHRVEDEGEGKHSQASDRHKPCKHSKGRGMGKLGRDQELAKGERPSALLGDEHVDDFAVVIAGRPLRPNPSRDEDLYATPECQAAVLMYCGVWLAVLVSGLLAVLYAARRRTMLRQKFGIKGSKVSDFCAWCWCAPCALCQETRTLWSNNVQQGVWHGPMQNVAVTDPAPSVPAGQFMTSDA